MTRNRPFLLVALGISKRRIRAPADGLESDGAFYVARKRVRPMVPVALLLAERQHHRLTSTDGRSARGRGRRGHPWMICPQAEADQPELFISLAGLGRGIRIP